ncbi:unnamed protein product [Rodentolepis nana]|uniref:Aldo_ket_red domain-containing protein n=1 Tax=Rodentolepis nana TaxID=102285 RepID=A0A158QI83_RODNA|nr:unnamed protein product [Rodentolepis nana]
MSFGPCLKLNSGHEIPQLAYGTYDVMFTDVINVMKAAFGAGYRHIDCAMFYGNEKEIGQAIAESMKEYNLKRKDIFVTSKLACDRHDPKDVKRSCEETLKDLGLDYLDLYLIHSPFSFHLKDGNNPNFKDPKAFVFEDHKLEDTWREMEKLVPAGLAKSVGVSNFNKRQIEHIIKHGTMVPAVNQVEVHLHWLNTKLIEFCQSKGIQVEAYAPFGSPGFIKENVKSLFQLEAVVEIANKHKVSPGQVLIRHALQRNLIVIAKSVTPERIKKNFDVMGFELTNDEMDKLNKSGMNIRLFKFSAKKHSELQTSTTVAWDKGYRFCIRLHKGRKIPKPDVLNAIKTAFGAGYRHFDCGMFYGNEKEVGQAIAESMKEHNLKREDIFVASKLWSDRNDPKKVKRSCEESLKDLGLEYLDLYIVHWPVSFHFEDGVGFYFNVPKTLVYDNIKIEDTWREMEKLVHAGLAKSVGVSNFNKRQIERIIEHGTIVPAVNQIEVHLHWLNTKLIEFCQSKGIQVEAYSPFGSPGVVKDKVKSLFQLEAVVEIANKHKVTPGQVLIRHGIQRNLIVIAKSVTPERIHKNIDVMGFELTKEEMNRLNKSGMNIRLFKIPAGHEIPQLAFGTFDAPKSVVVNAVKTAFRAGYRHIDCAKFYGNEKEIGQGIAESMKEYNIKREDIFVTSKLWCDRHDPKDVKGAFEETLKDLGLKYLDLYIIHFPVSFRFADGVIFDQDDPKTVVLENHKLEDTWREMEKLVPAGLAKSVGVANFNKRQIERIIKHGTIVPAVNQVEVHLHFLNTKLIEFCQSKGIQVEAYSPFGSPGFLNDKIKSLFLLGVVVEIANKHKVTPAQVLIRHGLQRNLVVIAKSVTPERIRTNLDVLGFELTNEEMDKLNKAGLNTRLYRISSLAEHPEYPYHDEF